MTQKNLFGSVAKEEPKTVKTKKPKKTGTPKSNAEPVPVESPVKTYKKYKEEASVESNGDIIKRYSGNYCSMIEYSYERIVDSRTFNVCCQNLETALDNKVYNREIVDMLKIIIESANLDRIQMLYVYASMQMVLFNYLNEVYPNLDTNMIFAVVDRAYAELIYSV